REGVWVGGPGRRWTSGAGTARAARARSLLVGLAWAGASPGGSAPPDPCQAAADCCSMGLLLPSCVPRIGTLWKASHGRGGVGGGRSSGAAPLACLWPLLFFRLERLRNVMLWSLLRQGPAPFGRAAAQQP